MIVVDIPRGEKNSPQYQNQLRLKTLIRSMGILCDASPLDGGDACFEGYGPDGIMGIGVERKALHDMLNNIDTSNYSAKQRISMKSLYKVSFLAVEGMWRPREDGILMESRDGCTWWPCRPNGKSVMYSKLRRYLISISYSGVIVIFTRDIFHTAYDICEIFHYHQKKWENHTSLLELNKIAIPQLTAKPPLVLQWANAIDGNGVKISQEAAKLFRKPIRLANSSEQDWIKLPNVGPKKAIDIVRQIQGVQR